MSKAALDRRRAGSSDKIDTSVGGLYQGTYHCVELMIERGPEQ